jgi:hypothetical protein
LHDDGVAGRAVACQDDRERLLTLLERLLADRRLGGKKGTPEQQRAFERIRTLLGGGGVSRKRAPRVKQS